MRKYAARLAAALALVACTGDHAGSPSAPRKDVSTAYLVASIAHPAPGSVVTMTIRPGAGDVPLGSFAARVHFPSGISFVAGHDGEGMHAIRASGDTLMIAVAQPTGFTDALFAFDVRVNAPDNLSLMRLEMIEATPMAGPVSVTMDSSLASAASIPLWGDLTFDGNVTAADAQGIISASLAISVSSAFQLPLGDANCDGVLAAADAQIVLAKAVGDSVSQFCVAKEAFLVMAGQIRDAVSYTAVGGARLTLTASGTDAAVSVPKQAVTDLNGSFVFYNNIPNGTYSMVVAANGYITANAAAVTLDKAKPQLIEATLTPSGFATKFGSVTGRILAADSTPVSGAAVQLSGGIQTNGPYKATTTGADGSYSFAGVGLTDENKTPIASFTVTARSTTGAVGSKAVTIVANEIKAGVNVTVLPPTGTITTFFEEGFDTAIPGTWTASGLWTHRAAATLITNKAYPTFVRLAPNDVSNGALPAPMSGAGAVWAGSVGTGNFIGTQVAGDFALSGGTGENSTEGLLTSPTIAVPSGASHVTLYFDAWFEVESVNPNAQGYDIMEITVTDVGASKTRSLTRLNPFEDPPLTNRYAIPFTSGGFNRKPVWRPVYFNLDAYKGKNIKVGFCFRSVDSQFNGFRGWLIDNVRLSDETGFTAPPPVSEGKPVGLPIRGDTSSDVAGGFVFSCNNGVEDIPVASVAVTPSTASLKITETLQLFATPKDSIGTGLAGRFVSWSTTDTLVATVDQTGIVTAKSSGSVTIRATVESKIGSAAITVGVPTSTISINAGDNQTSLAGQNTSIQPSVKIRSATGQPVVGATVTFVVDSGGGGINGATQTTNANGIATLTSWTLGTAAGRNTLKVSSPAATNGPLTFVATGAATGLNLTIETVQLTQATQTIAGDVPLVAGRPALLRVFVKAGQSNTAKPTVKVQFYQGDSVVKTYTVTSTNTSVPTVVAEATLASSWNLSIPAADIVPGISILAEVDPGAAITEIDETDNFYPKTKAPVALDVRSVPSFNVTFVPVTQAGGVAAAINDGNKDAFMDFAKRVYPFGATDAIVHEPFNYGATLSSGYDATWTNLLLQLKALRVAELPAPGTSRNYYGVFHPTYISGGTGLAYVGDPAAVGTDLTTPTAGAATDVRSYTAAHEWGHNFNRRHVDCGSPVNVDLSYPYATFSMGATGYDVFKNTFMASGSRVDLMSYCTVPWISDYTYKAVLEYRGAGPGGTGSAAVIRSKLPVRSMLVWGQIGPNGITLEPSFEVNAVPSLPAVAGPHSIEAIDASGQVIYNLSFAGDEVDHMAGVRHFAYVVPLPQGGATAAALRLRANGREVINRATGAVTPTGGAARMSRVGARSRLTWSATDYPMAMVRDAATGQIISFSRGGTADISTRRDVEVILSNGVTSTSRRLSVPPQ